MTPEEVRDGIRTAAQDIMRERGAEITGGMPPSKDKFINLKSRTHVAEPTTRDECRKIAEETLRPDLSLGKVYIYAMRFWAHPKGFEYIITLIYH